MKSFVSIASFLLLASPQIQADPVTNAPILYIGDSISYGNFGKTMDNSLRAVSSVVTSEASCGSRPATWLADPKDPTRKYAQTVCGFWKQTSPQTKTNQGLRVKNLMTPLLSNEIAAVKPKIVIVQLGTNIASGSPTGSIPSIDQMLQLIKNSGSKCIWIGPPDADSPVVPIANLNLTTDILKTETAKYGCSFVDTLSFTHYPTIPANTPANLRPDGIHPAPTLATQWGNAVASRVMPTVDQDLGINPPAQAPASGSVDSTNGSASAPAK